MTLLYPQLGSGALSQFPVRKTRRTRTVTNRSADGTEIKLADPAGIITEWSLTYEDLSDQEADALQNFFDSTEGSLNEFTFLDPAGNLLAWSDQLDNDVWQKDPLLAVTGGAADPMGKALAWRLSNNGAASQGVYQTIAAPGGYQYCLSAYARAEATNSVRLWAGSDSRSEQVTSIWNRIVMTTAIPIDVASVRFGIEVPAQNSVQLYGIQVDAQPGPSNYKATSRGGVYENAHLRDDSLAITKTGVNRNRCTVNIIHANHL
jgi:hypothetical protein